MSPLFGKNKENTTENTAPQTGEEQTGTEQHHGGHRPPMPPQGFQGGQMPQGFPGQLNADAEGQELTQEQLQNAMQGWTEGQRPPMPPQGFQGGQMPQGFPGQQTANGEAAQADTENAQSQGGFGGQRPPMPPQGFNGGQMPQGFPGNAQGQNSSLNDEAQVMTLNTEGQTEV